MQVSETAPLNAKKQTNSYDLDLPTVTNDGERRPFIEDDDEDDISVHSDTSYPDSVEEGLRPTNADDEEEKEQPKAWKTLLGMTLVAVGTALFCTNGAIVQKHGGSILQLMLGRYVVQFVLSSILWFWNPWDIRNGAVHWYGDDEKRKYIWMRGAALFATVFFWWRGLELVPLGDGESILFLSPMTTVIVARVLLKEELPWTFIPAAIVSFTGLTFICQPSFLFAGTEYEEISWEGVLYLIAAMLCWSASCITVRYVKGASWLQFQFALTTQSILIWCPLLIIIAKFVPGASLIDQAAWSWTWDTWVVMGIIGTFSFLALVCNVNGYQQGEATKVAWMEYLDLVFAFLYQWLYEKDTPDRWELIGCMCLLSTCLINLVEEVYLYCRAKATANMEPTDEKYLTDGPAMTDLADTRNSRNSTPEHKMPGDEREPLLKLVLPAVDARYNGGNEYMSIQN